MVLQLDIGPPDRSPGCAAGLFAARNFQLLGGYGLCWVLAVLGPSSNRFFDKTSVGNKTTVLLLAVSP